MPYCYHIFLLFTLAAFIQLVATVSNIDPNGYLLYCPCMGRFGNQADHLLGSLAFAKKLNRTLVVPPFINYGSTTDNSYIHYSDWFDLTTLVRFHKVIEMKDFMDNLAPEIWPRGNRTIYCHQVATKRSPDGKSCPAKDGKPFGPFWDNFEIDFDRSKLFGYDLSYYSTKQQWHNRFSEDRVMAFMGAMAAYPVIEEHRHIQKYVEWNEAVAARRDDFVLRHFSREPYMAIHLRNGPDWKRACQHVNKEEGVRHHFMSSPQCVGYNTDTLFTHPMCAPPEKVVEREVVEAMRSENLRQLFVATDHHDMKDRFEKLFREKGLRVKVVVNEERSVELDLAVMVRAHRFIGTCASSITAFVVRKRDTLNKPSRFFAVERHVARHVEL